MPYPKEIASGESLRWLENNPTLEEFKRKILIDENVEALEPELCNISRRHWTPRRVIAIDGSHITVPHNRNFPVREVGIVIVAVVSINLNLLHNLPANTIPRPKIFHDMEQAMSYVKEPVPGIHVSDAEVANDTDVNFFRRTVYQIFSRDLEAHETLLDTLRAIIAPPYTPSSKCPKEGCTENFVMGKDTCPKCGEEWYETDVLRLHQYFINSTSSMQAHSILRSTLEIVVLLNLLRFFADKCPEFLAESLFVLDGPLATFGSSASILRPVRNELERINKIALKANKQDIALVGIEKSGILREHWRQLDFHKEKGEYARFPNSTVITPDGDYIQKNVKFNNPQNPYGSDTHFGRFVLYKTNRGEHIVLNTAMLSKRSRDFNDNNLDCFHRLGDILDVMDELATYLYRGGFMPLVRAHANAAIPLKRGADIIKSLFED